LVAGHDDTALPDASAAEADRTLTRLGTSVLGRFNGNVVAHRRTVLDQTPGQTDHALITEAAAGRRQTEGHRNLLDLDADFGHDPLHLTK
jgi:hypothetical protein